MSWPGWRRRRLAWCCVRWVCVSVALLGLSVVLLGYYLNRVGLPEAAKRRVVAALREHGWEVQFSRLRLRWYRGLVADDLQLERTNRWEGPQIYIERAECPLSHAALGRLELLATSIQVTNARVTWGLERPGRTRQFLDLREISGHLSFKADDSWELHGLRGVYQNLQLRISGTLTNSSALRDWRFAPEAGARPGAVEEWLDRIEAMADKVRVAGAPELELVLHGDARTWEEFHAGARLRVPGFNSPWGAGTNCLLSATWVTSRAFPESSLAELRVTADRGITPWGEGSRVRLSARMRSAPAGGMPTNAGIELRVEDVRTAWGDGRELALKLDAVPVAAGGGERETRVQLTLVEPATGWGGAERLTVMGRAIHLGTNWHPARGTGVLRLAGVETSWGKAGEAEFKWDFGLPSAATLWDTNRAWSERLAGVEFAADGVLTNATAGKFSAARADVGVRWAAPRLGVTAAAVDPVRGRGQAEFGLEQVGDDLDFRLAGSLPPAMLAGWLAPKAGWLEEVICPTPPQVVARGRLRLAEEGKGRGWTTHLLGCLEGTARVESGGWDFRGVTAESLAASVQLTNGVAQVSELEITRPEGKVTGMGAAGLLTGEFAAEVRSQVDPGAVRTLFSEPKLQRVFARVTFSEPPWISARVRGKAGELRSLQGSADVAVTNFTVNGESADVCSARVEYADGFVSVLEPYLERDGRVARGEGLGIDLKGRVLVLTNISGNLDPYALMRAINTNTAAIIARYAFASPPEVRASGVVGLRAGNHAEDLRLNIRGGPFRWHVFNLPSLSGDVHVLGQTAQLTNVAGEFYGGRIQGGAQFDWSRPEGTDAAFHLVVADCELGGLMGDVSSATNHLEGRLGGKLTITDANSEDLQSWQGFGHMTLEDGLIWDLPVFGLVSRMLNSFVPGLGYNRAREASARFTITNGVIHTDDLDIRATGMRVYFKGTVGFDERLDARVEAELLRDMPALGVVVSKVFWPVTKLFVLKVSGTWNDPDAEPLYVIPNLVSKIVLVPFRPWSTLKEIFGPLPEEAEPE